MTLVSSGVTFIFRIIVLKEGGYKMNTRSRLVLGVGLVLVGVLNILGYFNLISEHIVLPAISIFLFTLYFVFGGRRYYKNVGFLIPACILLLIQVGVLIEQNINIVSLEGTLFLGLIGTAFLLVYFIHTFWYKKARFGSRHWPLITAVSIYVFSGLVYLAEHLRLKYIEIILNNIWPVVLIVVGSSVILKNITNKSKNL